MSWRATSSSKLPPEKRPTCGKVGRLLGKPPRFVWDVMERAMGTLLRKEIDADARKRASVGDPIAELGLSSRTLNCLTRAGTWTIDGLLDWTELQVRDARYLGDASISEIKARLALEGWRLREESSE